MISKINRVIWIGMFLLSGCSTYKSSWECPKAQGIGCSSIQYADELAKRQILLNKNLPNDEDEE